MWPNDPQQPPTSEYPQVPPQPPYGQPPYGQPPYGLPPGPPRRSSTGPVAASLIALGLVLVLTIVSFAVAHSDSNASSSGQLPGGQSFQTEGQNGPQGRSSGDGNQGGTTRVPTNSTTTVETTPSTEQTTPQVPTLNITKVNNTIDEFFYGLLYHDVGRVKAVSCPARRADFNKGTYINGKEVYKWHYTYRITPGLSYVDVPVTVSLRNPNTGAIGGSWNYTWVVELVGSTYYMCGVRK